MAAFELLDCPSDVVGAALSVLMIQGCWLAILVERNPGVYAAELVCTVTRNDVHMINFVCMRVEMRMPEHVG